RAARRARDRAVGRRQVAEALRSGSAVRVFTDRRRSARARSARDPRDVLRQVLGVIGYLLDRGRISHYAASYSAVSNVLRPLGDVAGRRPRTEDLQLMPPARVDLATLGLEVRCSIHLSYGGLVPRNAQDDCARG